jgi:hypothetical protein
MPEGVGYSGSNVVAGAGLELNYVGEYCYAYSGVVQVASTNVKQLDFQTGKGIIQGHISCMGSVDDSNPALGSSTAFTISFNGVIVFKVKCDTENEDMPSVQTIPVVIPPYTGVTVEADNNNADAGLRTGASLTGRVIK